MRPILQFSMTLFSKVAITTGDKNGVGLEVAVKALNQMPASFKKNRALFFIFRHASQEKTQPQLFKLLDRHWSRLTFNNFDNALSFFTSHENTIPDNLLIDLALTSSEAEWVVIAAAACKNRKLSALVTGPLSKKITATLPNKPLGHTGIFRQMFPGKKLFMSFIGKDFNVILATDHLPLGKVENALKAEGLKAVISAAKKFKTLINSKKSVAILGFNPHSGESGLIGDTEKILFSRLPRDVVGPLVPDAAFFKKNWPVYSVFICLYHDQGLIPFKMHHGQDSGAHLTLGLPFIRTSVDHGTATDLFNKNVANSNSMLEAIKLGIKLLGV